MKRLKFRIYASKDGNVFMAEIASLIASALRDLEYEADLLRDGLPTLDDDVVNLVVAPHEYFVFLRQYSIDERLDAARNCILISTEQPGTSWFDESVKYCKPAPCVFDINTSALPALLERGVKAHHLPLGYHPSWDMWHGNPDQARPTDVLVMASSTPRRQAFLARHAEALSTLDCDLRISRADTPAVGDRADFVSGRGKLELLARSKMLLNVHRGEHESFEWHRMLGAIANGCLVMTETAQDYTPLNPTEHFVMASLDSLADYAVAFAADDASRERIAAQAYRFVVNELSQTRLLERILPVIADERPKRSAARRLFSGRTAGRNTRDVDADFTTADQLIQRASAHDDPLAPVAPSVEGRRPTPRRSSTDGPDMWLRRILLNQLALRRTIEMVQAQMTVPGGAEHGIVKTAAYDVVVPDVSVVVTSYNYARFIEPCLQSVVGSVDVVPEIIIIDDHSSDSSVDKVRSFMADYDYYPIILLANHFNRGLPHARNKGFSFARSEYVFVLDADNLIVPNALAKLRTALSGSDAHFAYGVIAKFGRTEELLSCFPWDVPRLLIDNYIDAMAMIRRSAWQAAGGYTTSDAVYGWEDYTLWLDFAERGYRGEFVREIVGLYREHGSSMRSLGSLDARSAQEYLRATYPGLPWEVPVW